jgi:BA14K-like protein
MRLKFSVCAFVFLLSPASASVADYCAAYARDQADVESQQNPKWQTRYDNSLKSCTEQYSIRDDEVVVKSKPKPAIKPIVEKAKPKEPPKATVKTVAPAIVPNLEIGSAKWLAYCKNKYVSFNESKGSYLSKTGIERKCLVTAD